MARSLSHFSNLPPMSYYLDDAWKQFGDEAIATLGDRITMGTFDTRDSKNFTVQDFNHAREKMGEPMILLKYASGSYLGKYFWATGRALAGFAAKHVSPVAIKEAATGTCVQFDNLYPPNSSHVPFSDRYIMDGCRAPSETVNRWMLDPGDPERIADGFGDNQLAKYTTKQRKLTFMIDSSIYYKIDNAITSTFDRFARIYPEQFLDKYNTVPRDFTSMLANVLDAEARKARESGIKSRETKATRLARETIFNANSTNEFMSTKEPIVARQIVNWIVKDLRNEIKKKEMTMLDMPRALSRTISAKENPVITSATIDFVAKDAPENLRKMIRCSTFSDMLHFGASSITAGDKDRVDKLYHAYCFPPGYSGSSFK